MCIRDRAEREIKVEKSDFNIDNMLTTMRQYYRGGRYDFLLNSTENIDLLGKRFIVSLRRRRQEVRTRLRQEGWACFPG